MAHDEHLLLLLERRLAAARRGRPEVQSALETQEQLIRVSLASPRAPQLSPLPMPREQVAMRLRHGVPLLHDQPAHVDVDFAADLFGRALNVLQKLEHPELGGNLEIVIAAVTNGLLDPHQLFSEAFVQHHDHVAQLARYAGVDEQLLTVLAAHAVAPLLRAYAEHLLASVERLDDGSPNAAGWQRGYCPVCGGWPILAEFRGVDVGHYFRCAGCGGGYRAGALFCPYCENKELDSLPQLTVEGEHRFRVSVCGRCRGYLKVANALDPLPAELLALDDVASLHLNVLAIDRGYHRPTGSGFTIELAVPEEEWVEELA